MSFPKSDKIWMNGKLVAWDDARIHIGSHVVHYGSAVFEGIRCYATPEGPAVFRLDAHTARLYDSARIKRLPRSACTTVYPTGRRRHLLLPAQTYFLSNEKPAEGARFA